MTQRDPYPPFDAPEQIGGKDPADWTKAEARAYFDWLLEQVESRSTRLLAWLSVDDRPDHLAVLREVGPAAVERLKSPAFSGPGKPVPVVLKGHDFDYEVGPVLSVQGLALAADLGLLVARYLLADFGDAVRFEIGGRPKSWIWHNRPVLSGGAINPFDPTGASIANAYGVLRGERDASIWAQMYEHLAAALIADSSEHPPTHRLSRRYETGARGSSLCVRPACGDATRTREPTINS
jgi:hypothetical protein